MTSRTLTILVWTAALAAAAALVWTLLALLPWWAAAGVALIHAYYAAHGVLVFGRAVPFALAGARWLFGPVVGLALCTIGLLGLWAIGVRAGWMFLAAPWPAWLLLALPLERTAPDVPLPACDRRDLGAVLLLVLIVPAVVALPYTRVGAALPEGGRAYRAYFTADFVWAMTTVAEVSKGDLPPANPFLRGEPLRYYWLAHFLSSASYRAGQRLGLAMEPVILAHSVAYGVAFLLFLYGFCRACGGGPAAAGAAVALTVLASSFEALERIVVWRHAPDLWARLTDINVDAVTRWFYGAMPIDGLHRMLLYQPHHLTGYAAGLIALLLVGRIQQPSRPAAAAAAGTLLAVSVMYTSFTAIIIGAAVALVHAVRLLGRAGPLVVLRCGVLGAAPVAAAVGASVALGYVGSRPGGLLQFGPNALAFSHAGAALLLGLGPPLILGSLGLLVALIARREARPVAALAVTALAFYFFADVPGMQGVWVGWRSGHLLFVAAAAFIAVLFTWLSERPAWVRRPAWGLAAALAVAGLPTVAIDVYNAQDLANTRQGPGFPWVLRLTRGEVEALAWVRRHTAPGAVVQIDTLARANASWGYMTAFGERRMAAGLPIAMVPLDRYERATQRVHEGLFEQEHPLLAARFAQRLGIEYLYIGPVEHASHPDLFARLAAAPALFRLVFLNEDVAIFEVAGQGR